MHPGPSERRRTREAQPREDPILTLELLMCLGDDQPADVLDEPLGAEAPLILAQLPNGSTGRVAHNLKHHRGEAARAGVSLDRLDDFVESGLVPSYTAVPITSFDAILEISVPDDTAPPLLLRAPDGLGDRLGPYASGQG